MNINHHKQQSEESFSTSNKNNHNLTLTNRSKKDFSITKKFVMKGILL